MTMRRYFSLLPLILAGTPSVNVCYAESSSNGPGGSNWYDSRGLRNQRGASSANGGKPSNVRGWAGRNPTRETDPSLPSDSRSFEDVDVYGTRGDANYEDEFGEGGLGGMLDDDLGFDEDRLSLSDEDLDEEFSEFEASRKEGKGALYDAYNTLHSLAQDYCKPFDAPAVVVVGHQSSGKSALIEALMGFQFNQVGGGTKTRRPVALRMQYNPKCAHPRCFLVGEDGVERHMTLSEIQAYITRENDRLEKDPTRCFDAREINVRMEYKYCPNMILIDTPGLIAAPRVPRGRGGAGAAFKQQRALQASAREAERLVVDKMGCQDYIILCVEDTSDWKHGATREVVQKADPDLSRTVIVNTKLDTKVPQFGTPGDVADFLRAEIIDRLSPHKMGGPFFTSVPSGRVGRKEENSRATASDYLFQSDDDFVSACSITESGDKNLVSDRLKRLGGDSGNSHLMNRVGISSLRDFLEKRVDECYRRNVAKIIPMLQAEYVTTERRLEACERELDELSVDRLKAGADAFADEFCVYLRKSLQGSIVAPASLFGETLAQETSAAGSFHDVQGAPMAVSDRTWDRLVESDVGNQNHRLYGGSQYHRTLREFSLAVKCLRLPSVSEDEIANAAGIGTTHDGVNFLHAACTIALEKARVSFEPMLDLLRFRVTHVMERLCPVTEYMLRETRERTRSSKFEQSTGADDSKEFSGATDISQNPQFRQLLRSIFDKFVQKCSDDAMTKTRDDLTSITRYVTWNLDERSSGALHRSLPDQTDMVAVYQVALKSRNNKVKDDDDKSKEGSLTQAPQTLTPIPDSNRNDDRDYYNLLQLIEEAVCSRDANRTNLVVSSLAQHIVSGWRDTFSRSVTTKFNCYFMLPFTDEFHKFLRHELQKVYSGEGDSLYDVFDLAAARRSLQLQRQELINECMANKRLQEKFQRCAKLMSKKQEESLFSERTEDSGLESPGTK